MSEFAIEWSIDSQDELVVHVGEEVIHRVESGTSYRKLKVDYLNALRERYARFERMRTYDRRSSPRATSLLPV